MKMALLLPLALVACSSVTEGAALQVGLAQVGTPALQDDAGRAVQLTRGALSIGSVELVPCGGATETDSADLHFASLSLLHSESSPTLLGQPAAWSLTGGAAVTLGTLQPPPGSYCQLHVHFFPIDSDALGVEQKDVGATLVLEGDVGGAPFTLRGEGAAEAELTFSTPVDLTTEDQLTVSLSVPGSGWLTGVTFAAGNEAADAQRVLDNLVAQLAVTEPR